MTVKLPIPLTNQNEFRQLELQTFGKTLYRRQKKRVNSSAARRVKKLGASSADWKCSHCSSSKANQDYCKDCGEYR